MVVGTQEADQYRAKVERGRLLYLLECQRDSSHRLFRSPYGIEALISYVILLPFPFIFLRQNTARMSFSYLIFDHVRYEERQEKRDRRS